jgi:tetraacyldisaccharide 4'-kinase
MREPAFWWREAGLAAAALSPVAAVYGRIAGARLTQRGGRAAAPVVCIGNPTLGGAGKTPAALATARVLKDAGELPAFLSRGYGGVLAGPIAVDPARHGAADVGDEPLLLAQFAPTVVARARRAGAMLAARASVIVMDDGFQNPALSKDVCMLVVDERRGIGNGKVFPAGPLRAPLAAQLDCADALVLVGKRSRAAGLEEAARKRNIPVLRAHLQPDPEFMAALGPARVLAFAGIGDPDKFFTTLANAGIAVVRSRGFPDHHRYSAAQARALCEEADRDGLVLVTTEKDLMRLRGEEALAELAAQAHALPVRMTFEDEAAFKSLLFERIAAARNRLKTPQRL